MEQRVAERIAAERAARNWSYENLAAMMSRMGCPIHGSSIFKIERGEPRRRITVDELVGFAAAFGLEPAALLDEPDPASAAWANLREAAAVVIDLERKAGR